MGQQPQYSRQCDKNGELNPSSTKRCPRTKTVDEPTAG